MVLAFKEWSYIVDALGKGYQSIILRKGGISEDEGEFKLREKKFLLMPTLFHQAKDLIKPDWLEKLGEYNFYTKPDHVQINYFVEVIDQRIINDWEILKRLEDQHAWKEDIVKERYNRWEKQVHLLIVQVYRLKEPYYLQLKPEYEGCKSWIEINENISMEGEQVVYEKIKGTFFR